MIKLRLILPSEKAIFKNIFQKYLYEMTNYYAIEMNERGDYPYEYFELYFTEKARKAFFICENEVILGFMMINNHSYIGEKTSHVLSEFTVFPIYRKRHIGTEALNILFKMLGGSWEVKCNKENKKGTLFWEKVTKQFNPKRTLLDENETVLSFKVA